jgi:hypothetical protein
MWPWRKKRPEEPPQGVRICRPDGTSVECGLLREPDADREGCAAWIAVPLEPFAPGPDDQVQCAVLRSRPALRVDWNIPVSALPPDAIFRVTWDQG